MNVVFRHLSSVPDWKVCKTLMGNIAQQIEVDAKEVISTSESILVLLTIHMLWLNMFYK